MTDNVIDKQLAGALWIIGVEANSGLSNWSGSEQQEGIQQFNGNAIVDLLNAVESILVGFWLVGRPRSKERMTHGNSAA